MVKDGEDDRDLEDTTEQSGFIEALDNGQDPIAIFPENMLVSKLMCKNAMCSKISLGCAYPRSSFRVFISNTTETSFATENTPEVVCPTGYYAYRIFYRRFGGYGCSHIKLKCVEV